MKKLALTCKAEEIKAIQDFYASLPEDSYLVSILKGIPDYCERQIENDFGYGPLEELEARFADINKLEKKSIALAEQLATEQKDRATHEEQRRRLIEECRERDEAVARLLKEKADYQQANILAQEELTASALEVMRLKARLFDFMVAGEVKGAM